MPYPDKVLVVDALCNWRLVPDIVALINHVTVNFSGPLTISCLRSTFLPLLVRSRPAVTGLLCVRWVQKEDDCFLD